MKNYKILTAMKRFLALLLMLMTINAFSQVPQTMSFQGVLTDPTTGDPIADANYLMIFKIFDASTAGNEVWNETHDIVVVVNGLYNVILGSVDTPLPGGEFNRPLWLEVQVGTETLAPRYELSSSPYALTTSSVSGGEHIIPEFGNVGFGTTNPFRRLHVSGDAVDDGVYIRSQNTNPAGWSSFEMRNDASTSYRLNFGGSGSAYPNSLYFMDTNLGSPTFLIDPFGKVGIGTTAPFNLLHIQGTSTGGVGAKVENLDATGWSSLLLRNDIGHQYSLSVGGSAGSRPNSLYIFDNIFGSSRLLLNESGNLGIGTETPASKLDVVGTVTSTGIKMVDGNQATGRVLTSDVDGNASWSFLAKNTLITNIDDDVTAQAPINVSHTANQWTEVFSLSTQVTKVDDNSVLEILVFPSLVFDLPTSVQGQVEIRFNSVSPDFGFGWSANALSTVLATNQQTFYITGLPSDIYTVSFWYFEPTVTGTVSMTAGGDSNLIVIKEIGQ